MVEFGTHKQYDENDFKHMVRDPEFMTNRWKGRIQKGIRTLEKEKDPKKREQLRVMLYKQRKKMAEYQSKIKRK